MNKEFVVLSATRKAYSLDQVEGTMTVGELIAFLEGYDQNLPVCISNDNGYSYGAVRSNLFHKRMAENEETEE